MVVASPSKSEKIQRPVVRELGSYPKSNSDTVDESYSPPPGLPHPPVNINVVEHPVAQHALTALRNKHTPAKQFRVFSNQLLVLLALEATRTLPTREETVETPADSHVGNALDKPVVFLSLTRQGLGLAHSLAEFIPGVSIGSITVDHGSSGKLREPRLHLVNAPMLTDARVILFDPVVGAGFSASSALHLIHGSGATDIALLSFLISAPGLKRVQAAIPGLTVWTAAIEPELDAKRGPLPGLGNFAERLYG
jgi:uracil phosphoribosyltransferase